MHRPLATFNLDQDLRVRLHNAGLRSASDVESLQPGPLAQRIGGTLEDSARIHRQIQRNPPKSISALEALSVERRRASITTSCKALDDMLGGGGFSAGKVTEVCGPPGLGKTQIGMQACVNVQLPEVLGGAGGEALYVDTEGSFIIERVAEIAAAAERLMATDPRAADIPPPPVSTLLSRIHILRIHSPTAQVALTHQLPSFLSTHRNIKLIIIDSIAFHFRQAFSQADMPLRARLLNTTAQTLRRCAEEFTCAVVVMNQMTTKVGGEMGTGEGDAVLVPALGATWGHACTNRVILFWDQGVRRACLVKSPSLPERTVGFCITSEGVRDVPPSLPPPDNPRKRHHDD